MKTPVPSETTRSTGELRPSAQVAHPVDAETMELYVMGKLQDAAMVQHLKTCEICRPEVMEVKRFLKVMRIALRNHLDREQDPSE